MVPRDFNFIASNDYYYGLLDVARSQRSFNKRSYIDVLSETNSVLQLIKNELGHIAFPVVLCLEQAAAGRKLALEHSAKASLCESDILKVLMRQSGASRVNLG